MPELPDVAAFKTYLDATSLHQPIASTHVFDQRICGGASPALLARRLKGASLERSRRHGKFLFADAGERGWLVLHFGMTGELAYAQTPNALPDYTRFSLDFTNTLPRCIWVSAK